MNKLATGFCVLILAFTADAFAQNPTNFLEGTWRLVSQQAIYPDTVLVTTQLPPSTKILNSTHFSWGYQMNDGEAASAGGGRYTLVGDSLYIEHIEYHTSGPLVGLDIEFKCRVEGDKWHHTGSFPSGFRLEEVWQRIK